MDILVEGFEIIKENIGKRGYFIERLAWDITAGIDCRMYPLCFEPRKQIGAKVGLQQTFATRQGDTATRVFIKLTVGEQGRKKLVYAYRSAIECQCLTKTDIGALATILAKRAVKDVRPVEQLMRPVFAYACALHTTDALVRIVGKLSFCGKSFRVVAPDTTQRATFEKYSCSDAVAIVDGESFDFKNITCHKIFTDEFSKGFLPDG